MPICAMRLAFALTVVAAPIVADAARAGQIFVSNERDNTVTVLDAASLSIIKTIPVGVRPRGIVITPDHREVLVCNGDFGRHIGHRRREA